MAHEAVDVPFDFDAFPDSVGLPNLGDSSYFDQLDVTPLTVFEGMPLQAPLIKSEFVTHPDSPPSEMRETQFTCIEHTCGTCTEISCRSCGELCTIIC